MQALWVAVVASEWIHSIEPASSGTIPAGTEVVLGSSAIVHFSGIEQRSGGITRCEAVSFAISIVIIRFGNSSASVCQVTHAAVAIIEEVISIGTGGSGLGKLKVSGTFFGSSSWSQGRF